MWTEKYRPKVVEDLVGADAWVNFLKNFLQGAFREIKRVITVNKQIKEHNKNLPKSKQKKLEVNRKDKVALVLSGPPGCGKTTLVLAVANSLGLSVFETNASDSRTIKSIQELILPASKCRDVTTFFDPHRNPRKIVLIDEVDGISGTSERGGLKELIDILEVTKFPIVFTENESTVYEVKENLKSLHKVCQKLVLTPPSVKAIATLLKKIAEEEDLTITSEAIEAIAVASKGDFRGAVTDLFVGSPSVRDQSDWLLDAVKGFFGAKDTNDAEARLNKSPLNFKDFYVFLYDNMIPALPLESENKASDLIAKADLIMGKILSTNEWSLFPQFVEMLKIASTAFKKHEGKTYGRKWFSDRKKSIEECMNARTISAEEGWTVELLEDALAKRKKTLM